MVDPLDYLMQNGLTLEEITREQRAGISLEEQAKAVAAIRARGGEVRDGEHLEAVRPDDFSDAGNSDVFCRKCGQDLLYTDSRGWLWWDGMRWQANDHQAHRLAEELTASMLEDALGAYQEALFREAEVKALDTKNTEAQEKAAATVKREKAYLQHAQNTRNERKIRAFMELAKHRLVISPEMLDANPAELNTPGGIIDLTTGAVREHDRRALCTKVTGCAIDTENQDGATMWVQFLQTVSSGDVKLTAFLQQVAGMALFGQVYEEGLILAYGGGRNGKSTFFNALAAVFGDYAGEISIEALTTDRQNRGPEIVELRGKRLVLAGELEEGRRLSVSTVKKITSTDRITAAAKYRQPETFTPTHTLILHSNHLPRVGSRDEGTWRRLKLVEFAARIPESEGIQNYADLLFKKSGGVILAWAVQGAMDFARNGYKLMVPDIVAMKTEEYRQREDWLENFLNERCVLEPGSRAPAGELYQVYRQWAEDAGDYVRRLTDFNNAMEERGFERRNTHGRKSWVGLKIDCQARFSA